MNRRGTRHEHGSAQGPGGMLAPVRAGSEAICNSAAAGTGSAAIYYLPDLTFRPTLS